MVRKGTLAEVVSLAQAANYANQHEPILDSLQYLAPLSYDMMLFSIVQRLVHPSQDDKTKDDGVTISDGLKVWADVLVGVCFLVSANVVTAYYETPVVLLCSLSYLHFPTSLWKGKRGVCTASVGACKSCKACS